MYGSWVGGATAADAIADAGRLGISAQSWPNADVKHHKNEPRPEAGYAAGMRQSGG
jgi:hypothetical protein